MAGKVRTQLLALIAQKRLSPDSLCGCTPEEIATIEQQFNCRLPAEYRDFLTMAGKRSGKLFQGTDMHYADILNLRPDAEELLAARRLVHLLPVQACVFGMHQGYVFTFFVPDGDDPAVHQYLEGDSFISKPWDHFSDFMRDAIAQHILVWPNLDDDAPSV